MGDKGWFVTGLMYLGMILTAVFIRPLTLVVKMVGRYPKYSLNMAMTLGGGFCLWHALGHSVNSPFYTWVGFGLLFASLLMVFFVRETIEPRRTIRVYNEPDIWLRD